jgi:hypothetical protein
LVSASSLATLVSQSNTDPQAYFYDSALDRLHLKITARLQGGQDPIPFGTETIVEIDAQ